MKTKPRLRHVEVISARKYYGQHATGTVVLINGLPRHFTAQGQARMFAAKMKGVT